MLLDLLAVLLGIITGSTMAVATSCAWCVLQIPARIQDRMQATSPATLTWAMCIGLVLAALDNTMGFSLHLPAWCAALAFVPAGMFVGMLASALGEILEVVPVLMRRFHLGGESMGFHWVMTVGKGLGAVLACLIFTL